MALCGLYERNVRAWLHILQFGYWILNTWSYCGMIITWYYLFNLFLLKCYELRAKIAFKVHAKNIYKYLWISSWIILFCEFTFFALITVGMTVRSEFDIFLIGFYLYFGLLPLIMLITSIIFEIAGKSCCKILNML